MNNHFKIIPIFVGVPLGFILTRWLGDQWGLGGAVVGGTCGGLVGLAIYWYLRRNSD
jgi:hypothetical protein